MDFPRAWEIARSVQIEEHDEMCSYRISEGGCLCDCFVLTSNIEYLEEGKMEKIVITKVDVIDEGEGTEHSDVMFPGDNSSICIPSSLLIDGDRLWGDFTDENGVRFLRIGPPKEPAPGPEPETYRLVRKGDDWEVYLHGANTPAHTGKITTALDFLENMIDPEEDEYLLWPGCEFGFPEKKEPAPEPEEDEWEKWKKNAKYKIKGSTNWEHLIDNICEAFDNIPRKCRNGE